MMDRYSVNFRIKPHVRVTRWAPVVGGFGRQERFVALLKADRGARKILWIITVEVTGTAVMRWNRSADSTCKE